MLVATYAPHQYGNRSHSELRQKVNRLNQSNCPNQNEYAAYPERLHFVIAEQTKQRVGDESQTSDQRQQKRQQKLGCGAISTSQHRACIVDQRQGHQPGAEQSTSDTKAAWSRACAPNAWTCVHMNYPWLRISGPVKHRANGPGIQLLMSAVIR